MQETSMTERLKPAIAWTDDCQGKKDYDGEIIVISTRYWPASGGFMIFNRTAEGLHEIDPPVRRPHAKSELAIRHLDQHGSRELLTIAYRDFAAETQEEVQRQVEDWVQARMNEVVTVLRSYYDCLPRPAPVDGKEAPLGLYALSLVARHPLLGTVTRAVAIMATSMEEAKERGLYRAKWLWPESDFSGHIVSVVAVPAEMMAQVTHG